MSHNQKFLILSEVMVRMQENCVEINCSLGLILLKKGDMGGLWNTH